MRFPAIVVLLALSAATVASVPSGAQSVRLQVRQTSVRVPIQPVPIWRTPIAWKESKGPKCLGNGQFAGAQLTKPGVVDLILRDRRRVRAELERHCKGLDLYQGFYVRPTSDGRVCAERDNIYARSGAGCGIERFRLLTPR